MTSEEWRDVPGYGGQYQVSDMGQVRSVRKGKVRVLKPHVDGGGYWQVRLYRPGRPNGDSRKGHDYTEENTLWRTSAEGYHLRRCLTCKRDRNREYMRRYDKARRDRRAA